SVLAEFVMAAVLNFEKDFRRMICSQSEGKWSTFDVLAARGTTLAIIGYGNLGKEAAKLAHTFGMRVVVLRRRASGSAPDPHLAALYTRDRLHEMLAVC